MKKIITSALIAALSLGAAKAQSTTPSQPEASHHRHHDHFKKVIEKLNLSVEQKEKLKQLRSDMHSQMAGIKSDSQLNDTQKKERRMEIRKSFRSKMESVLTPAQKDELAKMRAEWKEKHKGTMAFNRGFHHHNLKKELNLTDAQADQLKAMRKETREKAMALRNDSSMSSDQKKEAFKELRQKRQEQLKNVLSPEQFQKLQDLHKQQRQDNSK